MINRYDEAIKSYDKSIQINPNFIEAYNNKGNALKDLKRFSEALDNYKKILEIKPEYEYNIDRFYFSMFITIGRDKLVKKLTLD